MVERGAGDKVLVVDDKVENLRLVKKVLAASGYEVTVAETGEEAIRIAQAELPDLILMDVRMPGGMDGLEATRLIRAIPELAHVSVVALTASVRPEDKQLALDAGCAGFIRKPVDINELPVQVEHYIAQGRA